MMRGCSLKRRAAFTDESGTQSIYPEHQTMRVRVRAPRESGAAAARGPVQSPPSRAIECGFV